MTERAPKGPRREVELPSELTLGDFLTKLNLLAKSRGFKTYMVEFDVRSAPSSFRNKYEELIETIVTKPVVIEKADVVEPVIAGSYLLVNEEAEEMYLVGIGQIGQPFEWSTTNFRHVTVSHIQWLSDLQNRPSLLKNIVGQAELDFDRREEWNDEFTPAALEDQTSTCRISGEDEFLSTLALSLAGSRIVLSG